MSNSFSIALFDRNKINPPAAGLPDFSLGDWLKSGLDKINPLTALAILPGIVSIQPHLSIDFHLHLPGANQRLRAIRSPQPGERKEDAQQRLGRHDAIHSHAIDLDESNTTKKTVGVDIDQAFDNTYDELYDNMSAFCHFGLGLGHKAYDFMTTTYQSLFQRASDRPGDSTPITAETIKSHPIPNLLDHIELPETRGLEDTKIQINQPFPESSVTDGGTVSKDDTQPKGFATKAWHSKDLPQGKFKLVGLLPANPKHKKQLQALGDALEAANFPDALYESHTLVNVNNLPGQNGFMGGLVNMLRGKAQQTIVHGALQRPVMNIIMDNKGQAFNRLELKRDTSYTLVLDKNNQVLTGITGEPSDEEVQQIVSWLDQQINDA